MQIIVQIKYISYTSTAWQVKGNIQIRHKSGCKPLKRRITVFRNNERLQGFCSTYCQLNIICLKKDTQSLNPISLVSGEEVSIAAFRLVYKKAVTKDLKKLQEKDISQLTSTGPPSGVPEFTSNIYRMLITCQPCS